LASGSIELKVGINEALIVAPSNIKIVCGIIVDMIKISLVIDAP
jgi:hypothetical protein